MRRTLRVALPCLVLLPFLVACGGAASSGAIELPTASVSFSPSIGFPTPTRTPTRTPSEPETSPPVPSSAPTSEPTTPPPTRTKPPDSAPTDEPTTQPTTQPTNEPPTSKPPKTQAAAEPSPTPTESPVAAPTENEVTAEESGAGWWWLLIPVLGVAAIVALLLNRQSRMRAAWDARLAEAEDDVGWFARDLIPQLRRAGSLEGVSGGWAVAVPRVGALDDRLSQMAATAPGDEGRARVAALQQAVRTARDRVAAVVSAGDAGAQWALDLDEAQAPLLAVLVPQATSADGEPSAR